MNMGINLSVEVLAGWGQTPSMVGGCAGDGGNSSGSSEAAESWKAGLCALFPRTSVTMCGKNVEDALIGSGKQVPWNHARHIW